MFKYNMKSLDLLLFSSVKNIFYKIPKRSIFLYPTKYYPRIFDSCNLYGVKVSFF